VEKLDITFGTLVAYILPGLLGLYAIAPFSQVVGNLLFSNGGIPSATSLVIILLFSLLMGLIVNAIGFITVRQALKNKNFMPPSAEEYAKITTDKLPVLDRINELTYKYFESYCNLSVSVSLLLLSRVLYKIEIIKNNINTFNFIVIFCVLIILLILARYAYRIYCVRMHKLLND